MRQFRFCLQAPNPGIFPEWKRPIYRHWPFGIFNSYKLKVTTDYLFGKSDDRHAVTEVIQTFREQLLIQKYRLLSSISKDLVEQVAEDLTHYENEYSQYILSHSNNFNHTVARKAIFYDFLSAGHIDDFYKYCPRQIIDIDAESPIQTHFVIRIKDDSMESVYIQGDLLCMRKQECVEDGEIGLFYYKIQFLIRMLEFYKGTIRLIPLNRKYDSVEVDNNAELKCYGKVLENHNRAHANGAH